MKIVSPEQLSKIQPNKYLAVNIVALEARRAIAALQRGDSQTPANPYDYALQRFLEGKLQFARLTEEELAAMGRDEYDNPGRGTV
uniref:DNA-directed RNA polymerase subunit omega n=1 Tax=candidate division WOR-3 bacterium TaxID=2052148 RepID=A0A7C4CAE2_UNCW3